jgi:hypothetical protein
MNAHNEAWRSYHRNHQFESESWALQSWMSCQCHQHHEHGHCPNYQG